MKYPYRLRFPGLILVVLAGFFFLLASCANNSRELSSRPANSPLKAWVGMSVDELKALYPDLTPIADSKERFTRQSEEFGLSGTWQYSFTNHKLHWFIFNASQTTIDKPNFNACLAATSSIIDNYKEILGQPQSYRVGIPSFNDPAIKPHNGYEVEQAVWESNAGRIKVDFSFLGENRAYEFLVSLQVSP